MPSISKISLTFAAAGACSLVLASHASADDDYGRRGNDRVYEVVITNMTRGQVLSPPVVVTHRRSLSLFTVGQPASPELAAIAEDADNAPLETLLASDRRVSDRQTAGAPVPPGQSVALEVKARRGVHRLSAVGMLVQTNDAFFAANGVRLPRFGSETYRVVAYDSGSEGNSELCSEIPGPPCGSVGVRNTDAAEGFVHIHAGIHGIGDLAPADFDWRNPAVQIRVTRIR